MPAFTQTGHQAVASVATSTGLTIPTGIRASHAIIQNNTANSFRWRADGTAPTATVGIVCAASATVEFMDPMVDYTGLLTQFKAIAVGTDTSLNVSYFAL